MPDIDQLYALRAAFWDATFTLGARWDASRPPGLAQSTADAWAAARTAYRSALAAGPVLWTDTAPALLAPVRLETRYLRDDATDSAVLAIRVIPDDIAHFTFQPALTPTEDTAARDYWASVNSDPTTADAAWNRILNQLGTARAAWAVEVTRAGSAVIDPTAGANQSPTSLLLPDHFVFRGWRDGQLVFDQSGATIPADLAIGPRLSDLSPSNKPDDPADWHPWTGALAWMVDLDAAVDAGMAVRIPLSGPNLALDRLTVVGVSPGSADDGAGALARTLQGHLFTDGLGYPAPGSPTNNTDAVRSEWNSRPTLRTPDDVVAAVAAAAAPDSAQPGVLLAGAFGLPADVRPAVPGRRDLLAAPGGTDNPGDLPLRANRVLAAYYDLTAPISTSTPHADWVFDEDRRAHFVDHVRAGGPLPVLRLGNQPYGILPVTSLFAWAPGDNPDTADELVTTILARQVARDAAVNAAPRLRADPDQDQDAIVLGLLQRQPTPQGIRAFNETGMSAGFPVTGDTAPNFADGPLARMTTEAGRSPNAARTDGYCTITATLNDLCHHDGLYWALQAYAVLHWQGAWAVLGSSPTQQVWDQTNAAIEAAMVPLLGLQDDDIAAVDAQLAAAASTLTCRLDAWATSVATARLQSTRTATPTGLHVGMYGWLVDVAPMAPEQRDDENGWVLTPSVQHAVTASVLFSGAEAHSSSAFDIDLSSARVRGARTLLAELRNGSTLEELLGYQFERALHEQGWDAAIPALRTAYPLPLAVAPDGGIDIDRAVRMILDGNRLRGDGPATIQRILTTALAAEHISVNLDTVTAMLADLDDTVDAAGDVLMAESVHHLVGGSALRAGLTADVLGKAIAPPEQLDAITTPTSAVTVGHCLAIEVPLADGGGSGWPGSPRAALDPAAEALAAWAFGAPGDWVLSYTDGSAGLGPAGLAMSALDLAVELTAPVDTSAVAARLRAHTAPPSAAATVTVTRADGHGGPDAAAQLAAAVRTVLGYCRACPDPQALLDPGAATASGGDLSATAARITAWWNDVRASLGDVAGLANLGLAGARPDSSASAVGQLASRWADTDPLITDPPPAPATIADASGWLDRVSAAVRPAAGDWFTPSVPLAGDGLPGTAPASGAGDDEVADWLRNHVPVCPGAAALSDLLVLSGACGAGRPPVWTVRQNVTDPNAAGAWVGTSHPGTRSAATVTALRIDSGDAAETHALLVVDRWDEAVPPAVVDGTDPQQQAALALRFDSPDSRAPQAVLLVAPPDPQRGWRFEDVQAAVEETLWWTTARPLDADDIPETLWEQ